jgi:hypothetical protein
MAHQNVSRFTRSDQQIIQHLNQSSVWFHAIPQMAVCQNPGTPGEPQNSWDLWMFIPLKMVLIGIDPYPNIKVSWNQFVQFCPGQSWIP